MNYWMIAPYLLGLAGSFLVIIRSVTEKTINAHAYLAVMLWVWICFVVTAGGDWMDHGRFAVPVLSLMAILMIKVLLDLVTPRVAGAFVVVLLVVQAVALGGYLNSDSSFSRPVTDLFSSRSLARMEEYSPFELSKSYYRPDINMVPRLKRMIPRLYEHEERPVVILSHTSGFVPYHLAKEHLGKFRWVDKYGLVTRDFTECFARDFFKVDQTGLQVKWYYYFKHRQRINRKCIGREPDLLYVTIFYTGRLSNLFTLMDYTLLRRDIVKRALRPKNPGSGNRFQDGVKLARALAINNDLLGRLPAEERRTILSLFDRTATPPGE
jgi:hypothetical protein